MTRRRHDADEWSPKPQEQQAQPKRTHCPYDGAPLMASGMCQDTGGYPYGTPCPFVCVVCRATLEWDGGCRKCRGVQHRGDPIVFPGDRYDLFDDNGKPLGDGQHWMRTEQGPRKAVTYEQDAEARQLMRQFAGREMSLGQVLEMLPFRPTT